MERTSADPDRNGMPPRAKRKQGSSAGPSGSGGTHAPPYKGTRSKKAAPQGDLHHAANTGNEGLCRDLIAAGADVNATKEYQIYHYSQKPSQNVSPLAVAIAYNHPPIARLLLDAGADLRPPTQPENNKPWPLLHVAVCQARSVELVDMLLATGRADVNAVFWLHTALHEAVLDSFSHPGGTPLVHRLLVEPGIDVDRATEVGDETPLARAVAYNLPGVVQALLDADADPDGVADIYVPEADEEEEDGPDDTPPPELGARDDYLVAFAPLHVAA